MRARHGWLAELMALAPKLLGTLGTSGASALLGIVSGTVAARVLGPSHRGELAQLLLWPQLVVTIGNLGIDVASVYLSGNEKRQRNVPATVLGLALAQSLVLVPAYLLLVPIVFRGSGVTDDALWMTPLIPLYLVGSISINCLCGPVALWRVQCCAHLAAGDVLRRDRRSGVGRAADAADGRDGVSGRARLL